MTLTLIVLVGILGVLFGKYLFKYWFNHISLYSFVWMILLSTYELRLMRYIELSSLTWQFVIVAYTSFILGSITVLFARNSFNCDELSSNPKEIDIFVNGTKLVEYLIIFSSIVGFLAALQHWYVLINRFGGVLEVLIQANLIYRLRVEGDIPGVIPYLHTIAYAGVFFSGIYVAYKRKVSFIAFLPFIAVIIKEIANLGRAGILIALLIFICAFFLYKNSFPVNKSKSSKKKKWVTIISVALVIGLFISAAGLIRSTRGVYESFQASTPELKKLQSGFFITPSLYLYMSSHIGVFEQFLKHDYDSPIEYGEITFQPLFNLLSKFGVVDHPGFYAKGYYIPMWSNTATYLQYVFSDFGLIGILLFPYFLGLFCSLFWFKFLNTKKSVFLIALTYLYVLILFSPITMASRLGVWFISFVILILIIPQIKYWQKFKNEQLSIIQ